LFARRVEENYDFGGRKLYWSENKSYLTFTPVELVESMKRAEIMTVVTRRDLKIMLREAYEH